MEANNAAIEWRLGQAEKRVDRIANAHREDHDRIARLQANCKVIEERVMNIDARLDELAAGQKAIVRGLLLAASTFATLAVAIATAIIQRH